MKTTSPLRTALTVMASLLLICFNLKPGFAQTSADFIGKWAGLVQINEAPAYRIYMEITKADPKAIQGNVSIYKFDDESLFKQETINLDYDKQKNIAFYTASLANPAGVMCSGWLIFKVDKSRKGYLEASFRAPKACMVTQIIMGRPEIMTTHSSFASLAGEKKPAVQPASAASNTISVKNVSKVVVKAQQLQPFSEGFAIVQYGKAQGLINSAGQFVIPYNTYQLMDFQLGSLEPQVGFVNGGCVVRDLKTGMMGMADKSGKLIIPATYLLMNPFDSEGWALATGADKKDVFINRSGVKIPVAEAFYRYEKGVIRQSGGIEDLFNAGPLRDRALSGKRYSGHFSDGVSPGQLPNGSSSYFDRKGKQMFSLTFASAQPFSDGLALHV